MNRPRLRHRSTTAKSSRRLQNSRHRQVSGSIRRSTAGSGCPMVPSTPTNRPTGQRTQTARERIRAPRWRTKAARELTGIPRWCTRTPTSITQFTVGRGSLLRGFGDGALGLTSVTTDLDTSVGIADTVSATAGPACTEPDRHASEPVATEAALVVIGPVRSWAHAAPAPINMAQVAFGAATAGPCTAAAALGAVAFRVPERSLGAVASAAAAAAAFTAVEATILGAVVSVAVDFTVARLAAEVSAAADFTVARHAAEVSAAVDFTVARLAAEAFMAAVASLPVADFTAAGPGMAAEGSATGDVDVSRRSVIE